MSGISGNEQLPHLHPAAVAKVVARGLYDLHRKIFESGAIILQDQSLHPPSTQLAGHLLSGLCLLDNCQDYGASTLEIMKMACKPMREWGIPSFAGDFEFGGTILICPDEKTPLPECRALAEGVDDDNPSEEHIFGELRTIISQIPPFMRASNYTTLRSFIVRNPAVSNNDLERLKNRLHADLVPLVNRLVYRSLPKRALHNGRLLLCNRCGVPRWPTQGARHEVDRCRLRSCRMRQGPLPGFRTIEEPDGWHLVTPELLIYWVSPGIDEIAIYDALREAGRNVELYPRLDEVDISVDGFAVGIDVKDWSCPVSLGNHMPKLLESELALYDRKIIAVPDARCQLDPDYLKTVKRIYPGHEMELMTTSQAIRRLRSSR